MTEVVEGNVVVPPKPRLVEYHKNVDVFPLTDTDEF